MFENLHVWAIEVDQNRQECNIGAQRGFIRDFGRSLYLSVDDPSSPLHSLQYVYFTRIFHPRRDEMGAYVRLNFFVEDEDIALASVEDELDSRLKEWENEGKVFDIKKKIKDSVKEAGDKGAKDFPELYYSYMHHMSCMAVKLFNRTGIEVDIDKILQTWTHNFVNLLRGF
jgi:hypothetical protein